MAETGRAVTAVGDEPPRSTGGAETGPVRASPGRRVVEVLLVLLAALLAVYQTRERDFWFHLAAGRSIVEHGLPATERWCRAAFGQWPWLGEWLYHVALYGVRELWGDAGVGLWRAIWSGLAMALVLALARLNRVGIGTVALLTPLTLAIVRSRMAARPEQVSMALLLLFLFVFEHARRTGRDRTAWLAPVQVVWANLHPSWILGPLVGGAYALLGVWSRAAGARRLTLRPALIALALYAAGGLTPQPLDTLSLRLVRDVRADPMMLTIEELRSWNWAEDRTEAFTAFVALAVVAAALGGVRAWRASPPLVLSGILGLAAGLASLRFRALGTLVALPSIGAALRGAVPDRAGASAGPGRSAVARAAAILPGVLAAVAAVAGVVWLVADAKYYPPGAAPLYDSVPVRAVALADSLGLDGPVLNTTEYGGYILWARGERHVPIQDTRHLGSAEFRSRFVRARLDPAALDTLLHDWDFTYAVLEPPMDPLDRLAGMLFRRPDWALIFVDAAGLLYVRRHRYPALAAARAYRLLSPDYTDLGVLATRAQTDTALGRALEAELERARAESGRDARASLWLGLLALSRGQARQALDRFDRVERLAPVTPGLALRQALAHELLGDVAGARRAYLRALRDTADAGLARSALQRLGR